jgi:hypothetical protein
MSYLLNYKNWRAIHESMVFEAKDSSLAQTGIGSGLVAVQKGNKIYDISSGSNAGSVTPQWGWLDPENSALFMQTLNNTVGFGGIPQLYINAGGGYAGGSTSNKTGDTDSLMDIFKLLICGIGRYHGIENLGDQMVEGIDGKTAQTRVEELGLTVTQDGEIQMYGSGAYRVSTSHKVTNDGTSLDSTKPVNSNDKRDILNYINTFNLINFAEGNSQQYSDIAACIDTNKVLQLGLGAKGVSVSETSLYLYSPKTANVVAADRSEQTTTTQGKAGLKDTLNLAFEPLKFATAKNDKGEIFPVDSTNPQIRDVANKILAALGEEQQITQMTLVSGASPNWQGKTVPESNGSGDPSGGKLNDTNFAAEKTALGNQWLAWRRGKQFAKVLEELLGPKRIANDIIIDWKVSATGAEGGRNLAYTVASTGVAPKETIETVFAGASYKVGGGSNTYYRYKFTWDYAKMTNATGGWMKKLFGNQTTGAAEVEVGQEITYKGRFQNANKDFYISDKKDDYKKAIVIEVRDGQPYIQGKDGPVLIGKDRFVSGPKSAKKTEVAD